MSRSRAKSPLLAAAQGLLALATLTLTGCPNGDVGAPCNHGSVQPPSTFLVTFPALSCNDLLCIYGEDQTVPMQGCKSDEECNDLGETTYSCNTEANMGDGACELSLDYVLDRSMCSKRCDTDSDCQNTSAIDKPVVEDEDTNCKNGFKCVVLQEIGQFCCEKLCVCDDDLPNTASIEESCSTPGPDGEPAICSQDN